jgi:hypothetical protein
MEQTSPTLAVTGRAGSVTGPAGRWTPHMTISYSTGIQPMAPIAVANYGVGWPAVIGA